MTHFLPIAFSLFVVASGCDNREGGEVPSEAGRGLAPASVEVPPKPSATNGEPPVAAWVDDHPIHASTVEDELDRIRRIHRRHRRPFTASVEAQKREQVLQRLIDETLIDRWIASSDVRVPSAEVEEVVQSRLERLYGSRETLERHLTERGSTLDEYRAALRRTLATQRLLTEGRTEDDEWTDADADAAVEKLYRDVANRPPKKLRFRLSSVRFDPGTSVESVREQLAGIDDEREFLRLAARLSARDPSFGWVELTAMNAALARRVQAVDPPGVTDPVETPAGYEVYFVHEQASAPTEHYEEVQPTLERRAEAIMHARARDALLRELREEAEIKIATEAGR